MTGPNDPQYPGPQDPQVPPDPSGQYPPQPYPPQQYPDPQYQGQQYQGQQYQGQQYQPQQYPSQPYSQPPYQGGPEYPGQSGTPTRMRLSGRVTERLAARPAPRLGVSLAGVGVGLAVVGVAVWGGSYIADGVVSNLESGGGAGSSSRHFLGAVLAVIVVAVGYVLAIRARRGPLATAGIAASALGVPVAVEFLTYSTSTNPVDSDAVIWISIVVWLASYLFVRGAQGHTFYLGLSLLALWEYGVFKSAPTAANAIGTQIALRFFPTNDLPSSNIDSATIAGVSLTIGIVYYLIAWGLDRTGRAGAGVAFALVGFPAIGLGIGALAPDLKQVGTGVVLLLAGLVLAYYGSRYNRRFTTWIWSVGAAGGGVLIVAKIASGGGAAIGISLIVLGVIFVIGAWLLAKVLDEPDDLVPSDLATSGAPG